MPKSEEFPRKLIGILLVLVAVVFLVVVVVGGINLSYSAHVKKINKDIEPAVERYHQTLLSDRNDGLFPGGDLHQPFHETEEGQKLVDYLYRRASRFWGNRDKVFSTRFVYLVTTEQDKDLYRYYRPLDNFDFSSGVFATTDLEFQIEQILNSKALPPNYETAEAIMEYYYCLAYLTEAMERKERLQITCYGEYREQLQKDIANFEILNDRFREQEERAMRVRTIFIPWLLNR